MGLAGQHTVYQKEWNTHAIEEDFMYPPVQSGFVASGTALPLVWNLGPTVAPTQCSGVLATLLSGAVGGQVQLTPPATAAAEGTLFTLPTFAVPSISGVSQGSLYFRARIRPDEVTTSGAMAFAVGMASAPWMSGTLLAGAVRASGTIFAVGKTSGVQNWALFANTGTSGVAVQCTANCGGNQSGQFYDVEGFLNPERGNTQFTAKVNGQFLKQANLSPISYSQPAVVTLPVDSTAMGLYVGVKLGASEAAGVTIDKIYGQVGTVYP